MKALSFLVAALFTASAYAAPSAIKRTVPKQVEEAVEIIYEFGRGTGDSGGISSITRYQNRGLSPIKLIKGIMFDWGPAEVTEIARTACERAGAPAGYDCARRVIQRDGSITANHQFDDVYKFIGEMRDWDFGRDQAQFNEKLDEVQAYAKRTLGEDFKAYSFGYDEVADIFVMIMMSKDRNQVLVFTADYGA